MDARTATIHGAASPVTGAVAWALMVSAILLVGVGLVTTVVASPTTSLPESRVVFLQADEFPERNSNRIGGVYDTVDILTTAQEKSIQTDISRASRLGIEMLVYTRMSDDSAAESQDFADRLNVEWGVESADGANDGLVYLVSVNAMDPDTNSVVISAGDAALPIRQLDRADLQRIMETEMAPEVADGEFNTAIQFGLRRVLNAMEYSPPNPEPLSSLQQSFHKTATILGTALLQLAVLGFFVVTIVRERRLTVSPDSGTLGIYAVCLAVASIVVGIVAIVGRNAFGSLTALATLIVASCLVPLLIGFQGRREGQAGKVLVVRRTGARARVIGTVDG